jgi:hypothetical protein
VTIEHEQFVRAELERWLLRDRRARRLTNAVRAAQRKLRRAIGDDAWRLYLAIEARTNTRHDAIINQVIRLARRR